MAFDYGFGGSIQFASYTLQVSKWTLDAESEVIDTTNTGDSGWRSVIRGVKKWSFTAEAPYDFANAPTSLTVGSSGTATLTLAASGKTYSGSCVISKHSVTNDPKTAVTFSVTCEGNGALTYPT